MDLSSDVLRIRNEGSLGAMLGVEDGPSYTLVVFISIIKRYNGRWEASKGMRLSLGVVGYE